MFTLFYKVVGLKGRLSCHLRCRNGVTVQRGQGDNCRAPPCLLCDRLVKSSVDSTSSNSSNSSDSTRNYVKIPILRQKERVGEGGEREDMVPEKRDMIPLVVR